MTTESELLHVDNDQIVRGLDNVDRADVSTDAEGDACSTRRVDRPHIPSRKPHELTPLMSTMSNTNDAFVEIHDDNGGNMHFDHCQHERDTATAHIAADETKGLLRLAIPFAGAQALSVIPSIAFGILLGNAAGDQSAVVLAASRLADFFQGMIVGTLSNGLGSALDTVCAQSFGAHQFRQLCLYAQAGVLALVYCVPLCVMLNLNSAALYKLVGQDPALADLAGVFTSISLLSLPFNALSGTAVSVLTSQHIVAPFVVIPVATNAIALPIAYLLGFYTRFGYVGILLGKVFADMLKLAMVAPLVATSPAFTAASWPGFQWREAHALMRRLVPLGVSSALMNTFQTLGLNAVPMLCGYLPNVKQSMAANNITSSIFSIAIVPTAGAFVSGCIRVGTALGAGKARRASIASTMGTTTTIAVSVASALISVFAVGAFTHGYTHDRVTADAATTLYFHNLPTILLLGWMLGVQGVLRACGRQWLIAVLSFIFLFVIGVPAGLVLGITAGLGPEGLWYGQMIGMLGCCIVTTLIVWRLDWDEVAQEVHSNTHVRAEPEPTQEPSPGASRTRPT